MSNKIISKTMLKINADLELILLTNHQLNTEKQKQKKQYLTQYLILCWEKKIITYQWLFNVVLQSDGQCQQSNQKSI